MPTLPYKENIWKEMPQNVNTGCRGGGGVRITESTFQFFLFLHTLFL